MRGKKAKKQKVKETKSKMTKTANEFRKVKGITLIALVVTIIVLLILAGISIAMLTGEGGILQNARDARDKTGRANVIEMAQLDVLQEQTSNQGRITEEKFKDILAKHFNYDLEDELPENLDDLTLSTKDGKYKDIKASEVYNGEFAPTAPKTVDEIKEAKELVGKNTDVMSDDNVKVKIPAGFTIPKESPNNAKEGIIITDSVDENGKSKGNEFVWIPVKENLNVVGTTKPMAKVSTAKGYAGTDGKTNYEGVLYNFEGVISTEGPEGDPSEYPYGQGTKECREPDTLDDYYDGGIDNLNNIKKILTGEENEKKYADINTFKNTMQEDYNEMIESVKTNGGFYVGRYEMKIDSDTHSAVSSNNGSAVTAENCYGWHGLYAYGKTYENTKKTTETSVKSSMIWGSQYDAMLNYVLTGSDKDKVTSKENGKAVLINVTDLVSSYEEWTLEGNSDNGRSIRGGWNSHDKSPSYREWSSASEFSSWTSSRITLYING